MDNQKIAQLGENLACRYLSGHHYRVIKRNLRFREGEIDIMASKKGLLIFVEVKTRTSWQFGYPETAMTDQKKQRLNLAVNRCLYQMDYQGDFRVDLIAIDLRGRQARLRHYQSIEL